jgi:hypothetical protein
MDEIREKLKPYEGKRIKIRGCLSAFADWMHKYRDIGRACIAQPELDGEVVADHVWVMGVQHWLGHKGDIGKQVEFSAVVKPYQDMKMAHRNYHLINPDELVVLHDPPAFRFPTPQADEDIPPPEEEAPVTDEKQVEPPPLETLRQVKGFTKAVGGQEQAEKVVEALEAVTIPVPDLIAWVKAMAE